MRKAVFVLGMAAGIAVVGLAWPAGAQEMRVDGYAAMVNDRVITFTDVLTFIAPFERQLRARYTGEELQAKLEEALEKGREALIEKALILEEFEAQGGQLPERVVDDHINSIIHDQFDDDRTAFLEALAEERMTLQEWRDRIKEQLVVMVLRRQVISARVAVSPSKVRKVYESRKDDYVVPEKVKLSMILVRGDDEAEDVTAKRQRADEALARLEAGADFAEVAAEVSEGSKASSGGDWGWIEPKALRSELAEVVKGLAPGEMSDVLEVAGVFYILRVEDRQEGRTVPFDEAKAAIEEELRAAEEERMYKEWVGRLREKYYVKIFGDD